MKKAVLLVAVFLMGITTQTIAQHNSNVVYKTGKNARYHNSQQIRFVENGVLYSVRTDGTFEFRRLHRPFVYSNSRRYYQHVNYNAAPGHVYGVQHKRRLRSQILTDRYGRIRSIGETRITYQRNGKVSSIGCVPLRYQRGLLVQAGNMQIVYNRRGMIRNTIGHVNSFNKKYWHEDWYRYNSDWDGDEWEDDWFDDRDRKRKKKTH